MRINYFVHHISAGDNDLSKQLQDLLNEQQPDRYQLSETQYGHCLVVLEFDVIKKKVE